MKLLISALTKVTFGILLVGALVFLPAGTLAYESAGCLWDCCLCPC